MQFQILPTIDKPIQFTVLSLLRQIVILVSAALLFARSASRTFSMEENGRFSTVSLITCSTNDVQQVLMFIVMGPQVLIKAPVTAVWAICKIANKEWQWTLSVDVAVIVLLCVVGVCIALAFIYAANWLLSTTQYWMMATFIQRVSRTMRGDISRKINRLPIWYYNRNTTGDVLSRVTNDVDNIGQSLNQSVGNMISQIVLLLGSLLMMLITNWIMTLTAVLATLVGFALMMAIMGRSQKYFSRQQKNLGALNRHIEEIYAGHTVVKAYNGEVRTNAPLMSSMADCARAALRRITSPA